MIYFGCFLLTVTLAVISRIHYSKYKDGRRHLPALLPVVIVKRMIRKNNVIGQNEVEQLALDWFVKLGSGCLLVLSAAFLLCGFASVGERYRPREQTIERQDYDGREISQKLNLIGDDEERILELTVAPLTYTKEEFEAAAEDAFDRLTEEITSMEDDGYVTEDIELPLTDEEGRFAYHWTSDRPDILTSYGKVEEDALGEETYPVRLTVKATYGDFEKTREIGVVVRKPERIGDSEMVDVEEKLLELERDNRNRKTLTLPDEINGVTISMQKNANQTSAKIMIIGLLSAMVLVVTAVSRLREDAARRDEQLAAFYPEVLSRLSLLVAAGMTIRASLERLAEREDVPEVLIREIHYTLHQIDAGQDETRCYENLGYRLELPEYQRLFDHISHHLSMGNDRLLKLMKDERDQAIIKRREYIRQRGETASTRMLFPMIILLALTMLVIIYPAFSGI